MADPTTITMNVSLPEPLKRFVDGKVTSGMYGSASEFVREAIREKLRRDEAREEAKAALTSKLLSALESESIPYDDQYTARMKAAFLKRHTQRVKSQ